MLINSLGNVTLKTGNFSGVTVEKKEVTFVRNGYKFVVTDLPGSYSLSDFTLEEKVTKKFLDDKQYDLILNVIDSTNLERNLFLTTELLLLDQKTVIALNMIDEAEKEEITIDEEQLSAIIGKTAVKTSAVKKTGLDKLLSTLISEFLNGNESSKILFSSTLEEEITNIENFIKKYNIKCRRSSRFAAIHLLQGNPEEMQEFKSSPYIVELFDILKTAHKHINIHYSSYELDEIFSDDLNAFAKGVVTETVSIKKKKGKTVTDKIDTIMIHPVIGLPIFLILMWILFQATFTLGAVPMEILDSLFSTVIISIKEFLGNGALASVVGDGALAGVAAVVMFLPNIIILFTGISLLETTGYMSRVAFLLDGFFHRFGLHGKSFIPLVTGFGCTVPAYMATRMLKNKRERFITLFVLGFVSCSAKLPIYVLFIGTFFAGHNAGNLLFLIYISGVIFALFASKVLKNTVFKGEEEPFAMEMPKYRMPSARLLFHSVMIQALSYLKKAGTFILFASVLVWFTSNYPVINEENITRSEALEQSYLGQFGKITAPFFKPLGFDWRMGVALEAGLAAKEVVVSTLQILYADNDDTENTNKSLTENLRRRISIPAAVSFIVFVMLYIPCFAAAAVFVRETGKFRYLAYLFLFTTVTAWVFSFLVFNITKYIGM